MTALPPPQKHLDPIKYQHFRTNQVLQSIRFQHEENKTKKRYKKGWERFADTKKTVVYLHPHKNASPIGIAQKREVH